MIHWIVTTCVLILICGASAQAGSCLPDVTSLQHFEVLQLDRDAQSRHRLKTMTHQAEVIETRTHVDLQYEADGNRELSLIFAFDEDFQGVSLPFNVYAVLITVDGEVLAYRDFTSACTEPGLSFFPGQTIRVPGAKLTGEGKRRLQLSIWGRQ